MNTHPSRSLPPHPVVSRPAYVFFLPWSLDAVGGVNRVVLSLAREMQREGRLHPIIFSSDWACVRPVAGEHQGIETLRWRVRSLPMGASLRERWAYRLWEVAFGRRLAAFCRARGVVCVNPHYPDDTSLSLARVMARRGIDARLFLSFHGSDVDRLDALDEPCKARWRSLLRQADASITCSNSLRERLLAALDLDTASGVRVSTVHNGIDLSAFTPARTPACAHAQPAGRRTVLCVGRFDANKNHRLLIDAFARLAAAHPDVDLHLVGADGPERQPLQAQAAALGLGGRVRWSLDVPPDAVARCYAQASAFVLPSQSESFGLVLLEAGACGLPVVASDLPSTREILTPGVHARLFASGQADALAQQLAAVLDDPQSAAAMGAALRQHVAGRFAWSNTLAAYLALLEPAPTPTHSTAHSPASSSARPAASA